LIKCLAKQLLIKNEMIIIPLSFLLLIYFFLVFLPHNLSFFPTPLPMLLCSGPKPYAPTMKAHNARVPRRPCPCTSATHVCVRESKSDHGHDGAHESEKGAGTSCFFMSIFSKKRKFCWGTSEKHGICWWAPSTQKIVESVYFFRKRVLLIILLISRTCGDKFVGNDFYFALVFKLHWFKVVVFSCTLDEATRLAVSYALVGVGRESGRSILTSASSACHRLDPPLLPKCFIPVAPLEVSNIGREVGRPGRSQAAPSSSMVVVELLLIIDSVTEKNKRITRHMNNMPATIPTSQKHHKWIQLQSILKIQFAKKNAPLVSEETQQIIAQREDEIYLHCCHFFENYGFSNMTCQ